MSAIELPPGFEMERLLGRSPLSEVYLVRDPEGQRRALKVLRASACRDPRILARFEREAALLGDLRHPNLVAGYGSIRAEGRPCLLLEYIDGPTLRELTQAGPIGWEQVARYGVQLARALDKLHRHGALHRDVKPHNVLVDAERGAVLADLGLVRRAEDPELTRHGAALGSPAYMSPEQARDPSGVGPEADVYSLGATLHHALSGAPPFLGKGVGEVIHRVLHMDPEPLPVSVPEPLARVLDTALAKDLERRYAKASDLAKDLGRVLLGHPPHLLTRHRRKRRRQALATVAAAPFLIWFAWWGGAQLVSGSGEVDSLEAARPETAEADREGDVPTERAPQQLDRGAQREYYQAWAGESLRRVRDAFEEGAYRVAWQSLDLFEQRSLPTGVDADFFLQLRRSELRSQRARLEQRAAEVFVDVAEVLQAQSEAARDAIVAGSFDPVAWRQQSERLLRERVPRAQQLPLFPGGESPDELLNSYLLTLERQNREAWRARAQELLPDLRLRVASQLQAGRLQHAWELWQELDPRLLEYSLLARREGWRMEQLHAAELALANQLASRLGRVWTVVMRGGVLEGRVSLPREGGAHWRIQKQDGERVEIKLVDLEPEAIGAVLDLAEPELEWLTAQLLWRNGELGRAIDRMRRLALRPWPAEADPFFWVVEWEREWALRAPVDVAAPTEPTVQPEEARIAAESPTSGQSQTPLEALAEDLRAELLDAEVRIVGDEVELLWRNFEFHPSWIRNWSNDARRLRLESWRCEWQLPLQARIPERMQIWGNVAFERQGNAWNLTVLGKKTRGVVLVPGARQSLEWDGKVVRFDGFEVGTWTPPGGRRVLLRGEASASFPMQEMQVRLSPARP